MPKSPGRGRRARPKPLPVFYDCGNCPAFCCSYPRIQLEVADVRRLAEHFGVDEATARRRFTKKGWEEGEIVLRHTRDPHYGTACRFLDRKTRRCTVYEARPDACRAYPGSPSCGYYSFLMVERSRQEDPELVARAYNPRED